MRNLTDSSAFTDPVPAIEDGDPLNEANLTSSTAQALANRTRYLKDVADINHGARYTLSGSGVANGSKYTLALAARSNTGYTLTGGNTVQVPEAGWYLITVHAAVANANTTNGLPIVLLVTPPGAGTMEAYGWRFSANAADAVGVAAHMVVQVTTPATDTISVYENSGAGNGTIVANKNGLSITRIA